MPDTGASADNTSPTTALAPGPAHVSENQADDDQVEKVPDFADLRTPDSPAFVLLGVSPTEIQRPTSPRQLAVTLRNAFAGKGKLGIPDSFALEASPFWLMRHDKLTLDEFVESSFFEQFAQNATVSVATTTTSQTDATTEMPASRTLLGFSARTRYERRVNSCRGAVTEKTDQVLAVANERYGKQMTQLMQQLNAQQKTEAEKKSALEALQKKIAEEVAAEYGAEFEVLVSRCEGVVGAHDGFVIDLAIAAALTFPEANIKRGDLSRFGAWTTFGYTGVHWSALALVRYQLSDLELNNKYGVGDLGGRLIGYFDRFAFSAEFVGRFVFNAAQGRDKAALWRASAAIDCHLGGGVWVNTTFGRDFDDSPNGSLIAQLNLRADIGERSIARPSLAKSMQERQVPRT